MCRHPLREDVSWNCDYFTCYSSIVVILFVRMWVEISVFPVSLRSNSVILFVRMWVEMSASFLISSTIPSSSSWGCELKYYRNEDIKKAAFVTLFVRMWVEINSTSIEFNQNIVILFVRMWVEMSYFMWDAVMKQSSSSWGCELKWCWIRSCWCKLPSSSSWRCELKSWRVRC